LLLAFLAATGLDDDSRHLVQRSRQGRFDHLRRVAETLGRGDQCTERTLDGDIEIEWDPVDRLDELLGTGIAQSHALDGHPGCKLTIQIAVQPDNHRPELEIA